MLFTPAEMELLCTFHATTRSATLAFLEKVALEMSEAKKPVAESAIQKLRTMSAGDTVTLMFAEE